MKQRSPDQEIVLEVGLVSLAGLILGGLAVWWSARALGAARHARYRRNAPPTPGIVSPERHQNIGAVSTR